jgi:preprotein translocase subunit SecE
MTDAKTGATTKEVVKRTTPGEFVRQVGFERRKISWPSRKETLTTSAFVGVFSFIMSLFFLGVDQVFGVIVKALVSLIG